ncbi:hypothetical protein BSU04_07355 [Caballeronia sordidicola]|uniref:Uncharacterized protein n=1 Tax=Caballeronia sordidicola TaxID=196367 RepID=A0A226X8Q1_CABSO|nr:hypothetical protein BSU04_07355 [Caballeronia sordidicola]
MWLMTICSREMIGSACFGQTNSCGRSTARRVARVFHSFARHG